MTIREVLADIAASMARNEADVARAAEKAAAHKGPWRRKTDAVDVEARTRDASLQKQLVTVPKPTRYYRDAELRKTDLVDIVDVPARVIEDPLALPGVEEIAP